MAQPEISARPQQGTLTEHAFQEPGRPHLARDTAPPFNAVYADARLYCCRHRALVALRGYRGSFGAMRGRFQFMG